MRKEAKLKRQDDKGNLEREVVEWRKSNELIAIECFNNTARKILEILKGISRRLK